MTYGAKEPGGTLMNVDPRQLQRFMKVPGFQQSLTTSQATAINRRIVQARWSNEERVVYDAVTEGYTSMDQLPVATGLSEAQIREALNGLSQKGYIRQVGAEAVEEKSL